MEPIFKEPTFEDPIFIIKSLSPSFLTFFPLKTALIAVLFTFFTKFLEVLSKLK